MATEKKTYNRRKEVDRETLLGPSLVRQADIFSSLMVDIFFPDRAMNRLSMLRAQEMGGVFSDILYSRNERAQEVQMEEVTTAAEIAKSLYHYPMFQTLCIDGRVLPVLVGAFSAGIGGSIRIPGGDLREVVSDRRGGMKILEGSNIDKMLDEAFQKNNLINELLDSHLSCAAKERGEKQKGKNPTDGGLLEDVKRKKAIANAMIKHVESKYVGTKKVNPIQFSFDPHNGYGYMGLETDTALEAGEKRKGFDADTLGILAADGQIISTFTLSYDTIIKRTFDTHLFKPDWTQRYPETTYQFWTNINEMQGELLPIIEERVQAIYNDSLSPEEIHDRALLLLSNAYSGYLHNYDQVYPYMNHREAGINITVGMHGPHKKPLFAVNDHDEGNLPGSTAFAATIVRANRAAENVTSSLLEKQDFIESPVPVLVVETVKDERTTLENISKIDFSDLPSINWFQMTDEQFHTYLSGKSADISLIETLAIDSLRKKMIRLYTPRVDTASQLIGGDLIPMPVITDKHREIKAIIPFFMTGY